jgi:hypothetical protein
MVPIAPMSRAIDKIELPHEEKANLNYALSVAVFSSRGGALFAEELSKCI